MSKKAKPILFYIGKFRVEFLNYRYQLPSDLTNCILSIEYDDGVRYSALDLFRLSTPFHFSFVPEETPTHKCYVLQLGCPIFSLDADLFVKEKQ